MPIIGRTMWERGARSPLAPREPFWGMAGCRCLFSMDTRVSTVSRRAPEKPLARLFKRSRIMPRTTSVGNAWPAPTAWVMITFFWSCTQSSLEMTTSLNFPNPVVTPYTTSSRSTKSSMIFLEARMRSTASASNSTKASKRQTAANSSRVKVSPVITTVCIKNPPLFSMLFLHKLFFHYKQLLSVYRHFLT